MDYITFFVFKQEERCLIREERIADIRPEVTGEFQMNESTYSIRVTASYVVVLGKVDRSNDRSNVQSLTFQYRLHILDVGTVCAY